MVFELSVLKGWDNLDGWESVCEAETRRLGTVTVLKVAAQARSKNQNPDLSEGNRKADELAKAYADQLFKDQLDDLTCKIAWVLDLQSHLIHQFCQKTSNIMLQEYELEVSR